MQGDNYKLALSNKPGMYTLLNKIKLGAYKEVDT
jgi:hypothetical protein